MYFETTTFLLAAYAILFASAAPAPWQWPKVDFNHHKDASHTMKAATENKGNSLPQCNMDKAVMPQAPKPLPPVSDGLRLSHVALGRGTQNYTCKAGDASAAPVANGANATLFNVSCIVGNYPRLATMMAKVSLRFPVPASDNQLAPANLFLSGHHYFTDATTPFFDLVTPGSNYGQVALAKLNATDAPNASHDVAWLKLAAKTGDWQFSEVYRVNTVGGHPPKTCKGQKKHIEVDYSAEYFFYSK